MEFESDAQKACYEVVSDYMTQMFGEMAVQSNEEPGFGLNVGSAVVSLFVRPLGEDSAWIDSRSWVVTGPEKSADLYRYLLSENAKMRLGAFAVDEDGDVVFKYGIVGDALDKSALRAAVLAVAHTADEYDDEIVSRFGGMTATDRMREA